MQRASGHELSRPANLGDLRYGTLSCDHSEW